MSLFYLVCVAIVASMCLVNADTSKAFRSKFSKIEFHSKNNISISVSRLLRSHSAANSKLAEERAGGLSVPGFKIIKGLFSSSKTQAEKLESWLKSGISADAVFTHLQLGKGGNPFVKPQFVDWIKYADDLSAKTPEMSAISTLTRQYGDDVLFRMIETAKMHPNTESIATKLEGEQMQHWLTTRKDPDEVFQLFQLNTMTRNNIFEKPEFTAWVKYVDDLNTKHPEEPTWMYSTLTKYLNDKVLFKLTDDMKWSETTKPFATKLEDDWLQAGLQSR
ncbi:RxLR effector protein, partial [Phytophthora megakarya]